MNLDRLLSSAPWAVAALVQVSLLALLGLLAWMAARRRGPALRGAVLAATLCGLLAVPVLAVVAPVWLPLPEWAIPSATVPSGPSASVAAPAFVLAPPVSPEFVAVLVPQPGGEGKLDGPAIEKKAGENDGVKVEAVFVNLSVAGDEAAVAPMLPTSSPPAPEPSSSWPLAGTLLALWFVGTTVCLARALVRLALLYRCARRARPVREAEWTEPLALLARRYGIGRVSLRESPAVTSPLTLGMFRPVILLPCQRRHWPAGQPALVLAHELAHARRGDFAAGLVAELAACLCWFHPLVRWLAGRLRLEQEFAADAWAASAAADATDYVRCLARLALGMGRGRGSLAPTLWRRRPEVFRRIDMLRTSPVGQSPRLGRTATCVVAALALVACLAVAGIGAIPPAEAGPTAATPSAQEARATADSHGDPLPGGALARLGTTRMRHGGDVFFVAFGPGGKAMFTAGQDNTVRLWDLATGNEVRRFARPKPLAPKVAPKKDKGAPGEVQVEEIMMMMGGAQDSGGNFSVAVAPGGKVLAISGGNVVQLYDVETGKELPQIEVPSGNLNSLLFSPDGQTVAGRVAGGGLFAWSAQTGKVVQEIKPPQRPRQDGVAIVIGGGGNDAPGLAFTPDGKALVAAGVDYKKDQAQHSVKFWDVASGKEIKKVSAPEGVNVSGVAVAPDGKLMAYGAGDSVHVCDSETGKEICKIQTGGVVSLGFTPDSKALAVRNRNKRLRLWEARTGKELHQLSDPEPPRQTGGLAFFFIGGFSGPELRTLSISGDGQRIAAVAGSTFRIWDVASGKEVSLLEGHWRTPSTIAVTRDGKTVISWGMDRVVRRWEAASGKALGTFAAPRGTTLAAFSPDARVVALANTDNSVRLHDTSTGKELSQIKGRQAGASALAFAPDGKVLAARGNDDFIRLYDVARGTELRAINVRPEPAARAGGTVIIFGGGGRRSNGTGPGVAFSPDGRLLVAPVSNNEGGAGNALAFFDAATGKELRKIESPRGIASYAFSPDGRTLAAENVDRTVTLWEVASGKERARMGQPVEVKPQTDNGLRAVVDLDGLANNFSDPAGPVGVTFSPDGRALMVRGPGRSVRIWDVVALKEIDQLKGHSGRIETVAIAPTGKALASGAADTTILVWDVASAMKDVARPRPMELKPADLETIWSDLSGADASKASTGIQKLVAAGAVSFLGEHLKPAVRVDPSKLGGWIADLDSDTFAVRREAVTNLVKVGEQAVPALQKALASEPPLETRKRLEELIDQLTGGVLSPEQLRVVRAVEALEHMGTLDARRLLRSLADGASGALPTREAQAALARMAE